jgi:hypothetical protein
MLIPKIKIRWATRAKQIKIGKIMYNILEGSWDGQGAFVPHLAAQPADDKSKIKSLQIFPYHPTKSMSECSVILIPFKNYCCTQTDMAAPEVSIANEPLKCVYSAVHYNVNFNRQGLYVNRKYRDKMEAEQMPENFTIIEPASMQINFTNLTHITLKINLS